MSSATIDKTKVNRKEILKNEINHTESGEDKDDLDEYFEYEDYYDADDDKSQNQTSIPILKKEQNTKDYKLFPIKGNDKVCINILSRAYISNAGLTKKNTYTYI